MCSGGHPWTIANQGQLDLRNLDMVRPLTTEYIPFAEPVIPFTVTAVPPENDRETVAPCDVVC
jgi:hypothetical protein